MPLVVFLSPAKKLDALTDCQQNCTTPNFIAQTSELVTSLQKMDRVQLHRIMPVSDKIIQLNIDRYLAWDFSEQPAGAKSAIYTFNGDVYRSLDINSLTEDSVDYLQKHLFIISGLYGLLKPLDAILPYRLEMGSKMATVSKQNLYDFWQAPFKEFFAKQKASCYLNLASNEYFKAVANHLKHHVIDVIFKNTTKTSPNYKIVGILAKRARGLMLHYLAQNKITDIEQVKKFALGGYSFCAKDSNATQLVFYGQ